MSVFEPGQVAPPLLGGGLLQKRVLVRLPDPQVTEHEPPTQFPQKP